MIADNLLVFTSNLFFAYNLNAMESIKDIRKKSFIFLFSGIASAVAGMTIGVISSNFDVDVGNIISIPAFIFLGAGIVLILAGARTHKKFRRLRNAYFSKRDGTDPFDYNTRIKINLLVGSSRKYLKNEETITSIFEYTSTKEPLSFVYFRYRLKPSDLEKIYKLFSNYAGVELFDHEHEEYYPYSVFLYEITFRVLALYIKDCLDNSFDEIIKLIMLFFKNNIDVELQKIASYGNEAFEQKYGGRM